MINLIHEIFLLSESEKQELESLKQDNEKLCFYHELLTKENESMRKEINNFKSESLMSQEIYKDLLNELNNKNTEIEELKEIIRTLSKYVR